MALGKSLKMDPRRPSSSYCSTVTIVVFVALCLAGVWMMTSSGGVPVNMSSSEVNSEVKNQVSDPGSHSFEDSSGDVPDDAGRRDDSTGMKDSQTETESETTEEQRTSEKTVQNTMEKIQEDNLDKGNEDKKDESEDASKNQTYSDENGKTESGEVIKEGTEKSEDNQEDGEEKNTEKKSEEPTDADQEKNGKQNSDETENNEQMKSSEQNSGETKGDEQQKPNEDNTSEQEKRSSDNTLQEGKDQGQIEEKVEQEQRKGIEENNDDNTNGTDKRDQTSKEVFPDGAQSELLNETNTQNGSFSTQAAESKNQKEVLAASPKGQDVEYSWKACNVTAGPDYIPCLDNEDAIKKLKSTKHYEHRERHCPTEAPTCLVPLPEGYKRPIQWPNSRDKIWYYNVPHTKLAAVKGHQNWVKVTGEYLTFPGGGTQFKHGALHYIDVIQQSFSDIAWGKRSRVVLDVGCGVASFGGYLFERDVVTMSFAPKDEHEAQVQFALERGIPAISAVMGTKRLPFPGRVFDVVHCARCRVPWHIEGGMLLLELNRLLRPGGYFVWSATPVYQKLEEDVEIWQAMSALTKSMCWEMVNKTKDSLNQVGLAIYRKPLDNKCYERRNENNPPLCQESDDPNAAWNISLQACMHRLPVDPNARGSQWPEKWPQRLESTPYWLKDSQVGVYGKPATEDFQADYEHWKHVVSNSYLSGMGIDWSTVRNVMDMRAVYGGFAAALRDLKVWVMNVVSIDSADTLPVIYERGLFGMYHNWCESFSTYPRTYDLLHADHLFSRVKKRCNILPVFVEVDRLLRPEGKLIVRDNVEIINEIENMAKSLQWEIRMTYSKKNEGLLCVQKTMWRPTEVE